MTTEPAFIDLLRTIGFAKADIEAAKNADPKAAAEAAKAAHPWVKEADVAGKNTDELAAAGILMPPIHARCRCTLVVGRFAGE